MAALIPRLFPASHKSISLFFFFADEKSRWRRTSPSPGLDFKRYVVLLSFFFFDAYPLSSSWIYND